jgi:undecaprenyl diphosphate synthase
MTSQAGWRKAALRLEGGGGGPHHVAIIMDGNGRWAEARGLPRSAGHRAGVEAVRRTVSAAIDLGISYLTLFSFSSENWSRPPAEVEFLFGLVRLFIRMDLARLHRDGVRVDVIGDRGGIPGDILGLIGEAETLTAGNRTLRLIVAFNYGARDEIARTVRKMAAEVAEGRLHPDAVDEATISAHLDTAGIPDPDLIIRTGGELRLSNFLLWQAAYSEFIFLPDYWPDFDGATLRAAVGEFGTRVRRYGGHPARSTA